MLALSTQHLLRDPPGAFRWPAALLQFGGVDYELTDQTPREQLPELIEALARQGRAVVGLRNYCPAPREVPLGRTAAEMLSLVAPDRESRSRAVTATRETLEWAARAEAKCVIVDVGACGMPSPTEKIEGLVHKRRWAGAEGIRAREFIALQRRPHAERAFDVLLQSMDRVLSHAEHLEIAVAIRNPLHYDHLPSATEFERLLRELRGSRLRSWYDVSHGRAREILGLESAFELRRAMGGPVSPPDDTDETPKPSLLMGYHLTDLRGSDVGLPIGEGEVDFRAVLEDVGSEVPMVVVAPRGTTPERIARALEVARNLGLDGPPPKPWEDHLPIIGR